MTFPRGGSTPVDLLGVEGGEVSVSLSGRGVDNCEVQRIM